ncbi:hypothetical protein MUU46_13125, partial [Scandinavium sp. TWS1a]|uniref:hypothetical protein n=1 Tax=Scandinavium tedordense TaxID=2926521 RepID=UPI0021669FA7
FGHGACAEQNDEGRYARKCTYRLRAGAVTGETRLKSDLFNKAVGILNTGARMIGSVSLWRIFI